MDAREQRGMEIAARLRLRCYGSRWRVPSQSHGDIYTVEMAGDAPTCTCPDYEMHGDKCKHIYAVLFTIEREALAVDMPDVEVEDEPPAPKPAKVTYAQAWPAYHAAQRNEQWEFMRLLYDLCQTIPQPPQANGRPRLSLGEMVFSAALKVYSTKSGRRFMGDLDTAHEKGYLTQVPHFNSVFNYMESPTLTPILDELIGVASTPLASVESAFAVDSSGFSTSPL